MFSNKINPIFPYDNSGEACGVEPDHTCTAIKTIALVKSNQSNVYNLIGVLHSPRIFRTVAVHTTLTKIKRGRKKKTKHKMRVYMKTLIEK